MHPLFYVYAVHVHQSREMTRYINVGRSGRWILLSVSFTFPTLCLKDCLCAGRGADDEEWWLWCEDEVWWWWAGVTMVGTPPPLTGETTAVLRGVAEAEALEGWWWRWEEEEGV